MDGWNVPVGLLDTQLLEVLVFILYAVFFECLVHVHRSSESLPDVAASMSIDFQVPFKNLLYGLLARHLQDVFVVRKHIYQLNSSAFVGQPANHECLVFPPLDLQFLGLQMQVFACWRIECSLSCIQVNACPWLSCSTVKKISYVGACCLNHWPCLLHYMAHSCTLNVFLDEVRQVEYLTEKDYPTVVGLIVKRHLCSCVVPLLLVWRWQIFLEFACHL